ncbi:MAG TPA: hypothetical protein VM841_08865 [Actinomycetota bacterium]|nr:hypothetical protein [Actinomycetota bacterium]
MSEAVFVDLGARPVWRVAGPAGMKFLDNVLTADLDDVTAGRGAIAALLTVKGRIRTIVRVLATAGGAALVECEPAAAGGVEEGLVRIAPLGGTEMERSDRHLLRFIGEVPPDLSPGGAEHSHAERDGAILIRTVWGGAGVDILAEPERAAEWIEVLSRHARAATAGDLEPIRIRDAFPRFGVDIDDSTHVLETTLPGHGAVADAKGCYPGQESVAKIRNLGHVRRRMVALEATGAAPSPGDPVCSEAGDEVGRVTSVAGSMALAIVKVDAGALTVGGAPASIVS